MATIQLDTLQIARKLKQLGYTQEQAEGHAEILKEATESVLAKVKEDTESNKTLTEDRFLLELEKTKNEMLKWVVGVGASTLIILGGMIAKGFKWF